MKYIINDDYKLLVHTFMYLYFDVYYIFIDKNVGTQSYCENIMDKLFNNQYNLYYFDRNTDNEFDTLIKQPPPVSSDKDVPVLVDTIFIGQKKIYDYLVNNTSANVLKVNFNVYDNQSLLVTFIKKFDDINYVSPIGIYFSWEDIIDYKYEINLKHLLFNDYLYKDKLSSIIYNVKNFY